MQNDFLPFFSLYLEQLKVEIEAYPGDDSLWLVPDGISNSSGNLCYHLTGNLLHFIGHGLGNTGYQRNRSLEFSIKGLTRAELVKTIEKTAEMMNDVLSKADGSAPFPAELFGYECTVNQALVRLLGHFAYHLGQVNYHRRLLAGADGVKGD
jgi:uncharacterized protein DUF1572